MSSSEEESGSEEELYEVDKVVDHRYEGKKIFFKVRWKGYPPSQDTWEPQDHLGEGCDEIIAAYYDTKAKNKEKKKASAQTSAKKGGANEMKITKKLASSSASTSTVSSKSTAPSTSNTSLNTSDDCSSPELFPMFKIKAPPSPPVTTSGTIKLSPAKPSPPITTIKSSPGKSSAPVTTSSTTKPPPTKPAVSSPVATTTSSKPAPAKSTPATTTKSLRAKLEPSAPVKVETCKVEQGLVSCPHISEYMSQKAADYETLTRSYEVQGLSQESITDSRRCLIALMSQLCDPEQSEMRAILEQLQTCLRRWNAGNPQKPGAQDQTSLMAAILLLDEDTVIARGSSCKTSVNKAIPGNWTPLHFAAALHKFKVSEWLLAQGSWPDIVTINQETPMSLAIKTSAPGENTEQLVKLIKCLISQGANVSHPDSSGKITAMLAKKNKLPNVASLISLHQKRLLDETTDVMVGHLMTHTDNLYLKHYFIEPQIITQPSGLTYTVRFRFKSPNVPCVARLTTVYCSQARLALGTGNLSKLKFTTEGPFPFKSVKLNGIFISPENKKYTSMTLKSELIVGQNMLELEMVDYVADQQVMDSVLIFGCLIAKALVLAV